MLVSLVSELMSCVSAVGRCRGRRASGTTCLFVWCRFNDDSDLKVLEQLVTEQAKMARRWSGALKGGICSLLEVEETVLMTSAVAEGLVKRKERHKLVLR